MYHSLWLRASATHSFFRPKGDSSWDYDLCSKPPDEAYEEFSILLLELGTEESTGPEEWSMKAENISVGCS